MRRYAAGLGPWIGHPLSGTGPDAPPRFTDVLELAYRAGLLGHPYTLCRDTLPQGFPTLESLLGTLLDLGIDGVFTDFPDLAVRCRDAWCKRHGSAYPSP